MKEDFRGLLKRLKEAGQLMEIDKSVDLRYVSGLRSKTDNPMLFKNIQGYPGWSVAAGVVANEESLAVALDMPRSEMAAYFNKAQNNPIGPKQVSEAPVKEEIYTGDDVDVTSIPIPILHDKDGGPYITSGVVFVKDPDIGPNAGMYRFMYRKDNELAIDLNSPSDLRLFYEKALEKDEPLEIAIAVGLHYKDLLAAAFKAPTGIYEMELAGGLWGESVKMVPGETVDVDVPADAEIIIEGQIEPKGWFEKEGPFGDVAGLQEGLKQNPVVTITGITHRKNPIFHSLLMPWETNWLHAPAHEAACLSALQTARVEVSALKMTLGGGCLWEVIAAIKKRAGEGKNALMSLLSVAEIKKAIVTDADVDIYDPIEVDRAVTLRVQADKDVIVISGARGKHLDPSIRSWEMGAGGLPLTAKLGIDATIPEGIGKEHYQDLTYAYSDEVSLKDYTD